MYKRKNLPFNSCVPPPHPFSANIPPLLVETLNKHFHCVFFLSRTGLGRPFDCVWLSWRRDRCAERIPLWLKEDSRLNNSLKNWNFLLRVCRLFLSGRGSVSLTPRVRDGNLSRSSHHFRFSPTHRLPMSRLHCIHQCSFCFRSPFYFEGNSKRRNSSSLFIIICSLRRNTIWNRRLTSKFASVKGRPNCWPLANIQVKPWKRPKRCRHQTSAWMSAYRSCSRENVIQSWASSRTRYTRDGRSQLFWIQSISFLFLFKPMTVVVGSGNSCKTFLLLLSKKLFFCLPNTRKATACPARLGLADLCFFMVWKDTDHFKRTEAIIDVSPFSVWPKSAQKSWTRPSSRPLTVQQLTKPSPTSSSCKILVASQQQLMFNCRVIFISTTALQPSPTLNWSWKSIIACFRMTCRLRWHPASCKNHSSILRTLGRKLSATSHHLILENLGFDHFWCRLAAESEMLCFLN